MKNTLAGPLLAERCLGVPRCHSCRGRFTGSSLGGAAITIRYFSPSRNPSADSSAFPAQGCPRRLGAERALGGRDWAILGREGLQFLGTQRARRKTLLASHGVRGAGDTTCRKAFFVFHVSPFVPFSQPSSPSSRAVSGGGWRNEDPHISIAEELARGRVGVGFVVGREGQPRLLPGAS